MRREQADKLDKTLTCLCLAVTVILSTLVGAQLGRRQLSNPFLHYDIAFTEAARDGNQIIFPDRGSLSGARYGVGRQLWMIAVGELLGLESQMPLQFMPIGSMLLSLAYFTVFKQLLGSNVMAGAMTLHQMVNPSQLLGVYSTFAYGLAMILYLGILLLLMRSLGERNPVEVALLFVFAAAINVVHYAFTVWVIVTGAIVNLWIWLAHRDPENHGTCREVHYLLAFTTFTVVAFLAFNEVLYDSYLGHIGDVKTLGGGWATFFSRLPWTHIAIGEAAYQFTYRRSEFISVLSALHLLVIFVPVILSVSLCTIARVQRRPPRCRTIAWLVVSSLILAGVIDTAIYTLRGNVGVKYYVLVYPVATVWLLTQMGDKQLALVAITGLLGLSTVRLGVELTEGQLALEPLSYSQARTATEWFHQHVPAHDSLVLTDLNLYGKLLVSGAAHGSRPGLLTITPEVYDWLLGSNLTEPEDLVRSDYLVLDVGSDAPLMTPFWRSLEPLRLHRTSIAQGNAAVKLYDDGSVWIMQP